MSDVADITVYGDEPAHLTVMVLDQSVERALRVRAAALGVDVGDVVNEIVWSTHALDSEMDYVHRAQSEQQDRDGHGPGL